MSKSTRPGVSWSSRRVWWVILWQFINIHKLRNSRQSSSLILRKHMETHFLIENDCFCRTEKDHNTPQRTKNEIISAVSNIPTTSFKASFHLLEELLGFSLFRHRSGRFSELLLTNFAKFVNCRSHRLCRSGTWYGVQRNLHGWRTDTRSNSGLRNW